MLTVTWSGGAGAGLVGVALVVATDGRRIVSSVSELSSWLLVGATPKTN